jgi:hypothetical protein
LVDVPGLFLAQTGPKELVGPFQVEEIPDLKERDHVVSEFGVVEDVLEFDVLEVDHLFALLPLALTGQNVVLEFQLTQLP